jgi:hypothetical protein
MWLRRNKVSIAGAVTNGARFSHVLMQADQLLDI